MNNAELKQQPRNIRKEFAAIHDSEVDGDLQIKTMIAELSTALDASQKAHRKHESVCSVFQRLPVEIANAEREIKEIKTKRIGTAAQGLIETDGTEFYSDDILLQQLRGAELYLERLQLAKIGLPHEEQRENSSAELASSHCAAIEDQINQRRDELKLREARRRHGCTLDPDEVLEEAIVAFFTTETVRELIKQIALPMIQSKIESLNSF